MADRLILSLPLGDIEVGTRVGFFNADHAARLAVSMTDEGQHSPIHVKRNGNAAKRKWKLVAGLHRLRGAEAARWTHIDAVQVADASASANELLRLELSENVDHRHRRPIERSILMVAHARLEEEIDHPGMVGESRQARGARVRHSAAAIIAEAENREPEDTRAIVAHVSRNTDRDACATVAQASGDAERDAWPIVSQASRGTGADAHATVAQASKDADRDTCATVAHVDDWRARTAAAFGVSLSTLKRHQHLYHGIVAHEALADLAQALNDHPLGEHLTAMTTLASVGLPSARRKAAETILSRTDCKSMVEVMVAAGLEQSTGTRVPEDAKMMDLWHRLKPERRQAHLDWLADDLLPGEAVAMLKRLKNRGVLP